MSTRLSTVVVVVDVDQISNHILMSGRKPNIYIKEKPPGQPAAGYPVHSRKDSEAHAYRRGGGRLAAPLRGKKRIF